MSNVRECLVVPGAPLVMLRSCMSAWVSIWMASPMTYPVFPQVTDYLQRSLQNPICIPGCKKRGWGGGGSDFSVLTTTDKSSLCRAASALFYRR